MLIVYDRLWQVLKEKKITKKTLASMAQLNRSTITKMSNNEIVSAQTVIDICKALRCRLEDVCEIMWLEQYREIQRRRSALKKRKRLKH